jgi:hypothetical protein
MTCTTAILTALRGRAEMNEGQHDTPHGPMMPAGWSAWADADADAASTREYAEREEEARVVQAHLDAGQDPELDKLVDNRAADWGVSRHRALTRLLPEREASVRVPGTVRSCHCLPVAIATGYGSAVSDRYPASISASGSHSS